MCSSSRISFPTRAACRLLWMAKRSVESLPAEQNRKLMKRSRRRGPMRWSRNNQKTKKETLRFEKVRRVERERKTTTKLDECPVLEPNRTRPLHLSNPSIETRYTFVNKMIIAAEANSW